MRPEFGCAIHDLVFDTIDAATIGGSISRSGRRSTAGSHGSRCGHRLRPDQCTPEGVLEILIDYRIRATNRRNNLVYPFYVIPTEPE